MWVIMGDERGANTCMCGYGPRGVRQRETVLSMRLNTWVVQQDIFRLVS